MLRRGLAAGVCAPTNDRRLILSPRRRPSLEEALQWRGSLDKLLQSSCKCPLGFTGAAREEEGMPSKAGSCSSDFVISYNFQSDSAREGAEGVW